MSGTITPLANATGEPMSTDVQDVQFVYRATVTIAQIFRLKWERRGGYDRSKGFAVANEVHCEAAAEQKNIRYPRCVAFSNA